MKHKGGLAGSILRAEMVTVTRSTCFLRHFLFSDAYLIGQLANWIVDQIFEIEARKWFGLAQRGSTQSRRAERGWRNEILSSD